MSKKSTRVQEYLTICTLTVLTVLVLLYSRGYSNILTDSWRAVDIPQHYEAQFLESTIIKIEQDGIPPLIKIHLLSKSGCTYIIAPAGRTLSLENQDEVEADAKCSPTLDAN